MEDIFDLVTQSSRGALPAVLEDLNAVTAQYGLFLTLGQLGALTERRNEALLSTGRLEFRHGVVGKLIVAFCDSAYIDQNNYEETISALIDSFYYFKNESEDLLSDDELIERMRLYFETVCQGSLDYLNGTSLETLCRLTRHGADPDAAAYDPDEEEELF
jgi:hypothetical protein